MTRVMPAVDAEATCEAGVFRERHGSRRRANGHGVRVDSRRHQAGYSALGGDLSHSTHLASPRLERSDSRLGGGSAGLT